MTTGPPSRDANFFSNRLVRGAILLTIILLLCLLVNYRHKQQPIKLTVVKQNSESLDLGCLYIVIPPNELIAWKEITFYIKPNPGGLRTSCKGIHRGNVTNGKSKFRIQAFGSKEMVTGSAEHVGNDTYRARLRLTFTDEYIFMAILTFINNDDLEYRVHKNAILQHVVKSPFQRRVSPGSSPARYTRYCKQDESGTAKGRWVECGKLEGIEDCSEWQLNPVYDFDQIHGFHWVPYDCQLHHYSNDEIKKCFARNGWSSIAFTGK